jgi:hypothetical protein
MLRSLKRFGFTTSELITVYRGYIRPLLEYSDVIWHSSMTSKQSNTLENIQKRSCRIILRRRFNSYINALQICDLEPLSVRREQHCLSFARSLSLSDRTRKLLPPSRLESHGRHLRNNTTITQINSRTNRFAKSPIPFYIGLLNNSS